MESAADAYANTRTIAVIFNRFEMLFSCCIRALHEVRVSLDHTSEDSTK